MHCLECLKAEDSFGWALDVFFNLPLGSFEAGSASNSRVLMVLENREVTRGRIGT